jgi:hypothetical protein
MDKMQSGSLTCLRHDKLNELLCTECKTYLCPECITDHVTDGHVAKYIHVLQYSPVNTLPKIDQLLAAAKGREEAVNAEAKELNTALQVFAPKFVEAVAQHAKAIEQLQTLTTQLQVYAGMKKQESYIEGVRTGLTNDKKALGEAIKAKDSQAALRIAQKVEAEELLAKQQETAQTVISRLDHVLDSISDIKGYQTLLNAANTVVAKCQFLRLVQYTQEWKCDRQYFSTKMFLSEDGLTFGNTASSGYPAIIGDVPFEHGLFAYEVIPSHLECAGKEGFGIIEREKYMAAVAADRTTPTVHDSMIGFLYKTDAKNMTAVRVGEMQLEAKYYVWVNLNELTLIIKGPGVHLTAELKAGVVYYPCFSCGCSSNRLKIRPLASYDEVDPLA